MQSYDCDFVGKCFSFGGFVRHVFNLAVSKTFAGCPEYEKVLNVAMRRTKSSLKIQLIAIFSDVFFIFSEQFFVILYFVSI